MALKHNMIMHFENIQKVILKVLQLSTEALLSTAELPLRVMNNHNVMVITTLDTGKDAAEHCRNDTSTASIKIRVKWQAQIQIL